MAIIGYLHQNSFAATERERGCFFRSYSDAAPVLLDDRLAVYLGITFLQSLHYELCVLHTANVAIVEPWLSNVERFLLAGEVTVIDDPVRRCRGGHRPR